MSLRQYRVNRLPLWWSRERLSALGAARAPAPGPQKHREMVEAPGIEPALRASGNPLRNATLARRCPESFGTVGPRRPTLYRAVPRCGAETRLMEGT
jgi:hypothetical protein